MKRRLLWSALAVCVACGSESSGSSTTPISPSGPVVISAGAASLHQQETWVAESGTGRLVAVWIGFMSNGNYTIEYAISEDDGQSWGKPVAVPMPPTLFSLGDPIVAADAAGNFVLVGLGISNSVAEVLAFKLAAGSSAFAAPAIVDSLLFGTEFFDRPQLVKTTAGYLVTYSRLRENETGGVGEAATSADGITWRVDTLAVNAPTLIEPCADGNSVTATYLNFFATGLWTTSSSDGGATWTVPSQVESTASDDQTVPGCVRRANDVWLVYGVADNGVGLYHSTDAGAHFTSVGRVEDGGALYGQIGLKSDGTLELAYYTSTSQVPFGLAHRFVAPGSQKMGAYTIVQSNLQINSSGNRFAQNGYADYIGVIPHGIVYTDNSTGTSHIAFYRESGR
jgi:hypothetical protein